MATRTRQFRTTLDLSEQERQTLEELAKRLGVSMQDVLRMALREKGERMGVAA